MQIKCAYTYEQYLVGHNVRVEEGGVDVPVQGPAHKHQLQDGPDNLQHASVHSQIRTPQNEEHYFSVHYRLYRVQCAVYTVYCTLYTVHCTLYTLHFTLYTVHCTLYTV